MASFPELTITDDDAVSSVVDDIAFAFDVLDEVKFFVLETLSISFSLDTRIGSTIAVEFLIFKY